MELRASFRANIWAIFRTEIILFNCHPGVAWAAVGQQQRRVLLPVGHAVAAALRLRHRRGHRQGHQAAEEGHQKDGEEKSL